MTTTNVKIDSVQLTRHVVTSNIACDGGFPYLFKHSLKCVLCTTVRNEDANNRWRTETMAHKTYPQRWAQLFDKSGRGNDNVVAMVTKDGNSGSGEFNQINCY